MRRLAFALFTAAAVLGACTQSKSGHSSDDHHDAAAAAHQIMLETGEVSVQDGLDAWTRVNEVLVHPRCANCHVGDDNTPMWTINGETTARPHGMNIDAGISRIGAETLVCSTCHMTSDAPNTVPHAAPHAAIPWQLAPVEFVWFGKSSAENCAQLKDPERNGGRDAEGLIEHLIHDADIGGVVAWGWVPGGDREPAPGTYEDHLMDVAMWGAAGQPCPEIAER